MSDRDRLLRIISETYGTRENALHTPVGRAMIAAADEAARKDGTCRFHTVTVMPCNPPRTVPIDNRDHSRKV